MSADIKHIENKLWNAADSLRANSPLTAHQYSQPVLGLIFLRFADVKFAQAEEEMKHGNAERSGASEARERSVGPEDYQAKEGVLYLPKEARYEYLLNLPEGENIGKAINNAMSKVEEYNADLKGVLPKTYTRLSDDILITLLKKFSEITLDKEGDVFGRIYEYFLGKFAAAEGARGGEFFTPTSIVKLIVEVIQPLSGRVYDPACGSGGMFVQSANFVKAHKNGNGVISIFGQEKSAETVKLAKMNLAVHGLSGDIKQGNTYYEDLHKSIRKFDYVMANPFFNVHGVDMEKIKDDPRLPFGVPRVDNANYVWIQYFYSALNKTGRAGFVMANSAADSRHSELEIRKKLVDDNAVDVMIAIGTNFFYTVTLPCTLWFLDKGKKKTDRKDKVLFIDARNIYHQIDRAHRDFTEEQLQQIVEIVHSYRKEKGAEKYKDIPGLCKVATLEEIRAQDYSLNPGRYVGTTKKETPDYDPDEKLKELTDKFKKLSKEAGMLEKRILKNVDDLLDD